MRQSFPSAIFVLALFEVAISNVSSGAENAVGVRGKWGCGADPKTQQRLLIDKPGVYENYRIDGRWVGKNLVKIVADDVTLRNCEIFNGAHNAIVVYAKNVTIENCKIHHLLKGTFDKQADAHGISGQPQNLTIRNCEIHHVSGDAVQFDPSRKPWSAVVIDNCSVWTAPLEADAAGFRKGERPGENAIDTKNLAANPRAKLTIRDSLFYGWAADGQISNMAALNLKENIRAVVENCVFRGNEICLRMRGGRGERGGARVTLSDCGVYDSDVAVRAEDGIEDLKIVRLGVGDGIKRTLVRAGGGTGSGFEFTEVTPPSFEIRTPRR